MHKLACSLLLTALKGQIIGVHQQLGQFLCAGSTFSAVLRSLPGAVLTGQTSLHVQGECHQGGQAAFQAAGNARLPCRAVR